MKEVARMKIDKYEFPDGLYYDKEHGWAKVEGNTVIQGLTDYGQHIAGEIIYAEVPRAGRTVEQGKPFMSMESGKWVGRMKAIVSGKISEANEELETASSLINESPYGDGWLIKIEASNLAVDLKNLLKADSATYQDYVKGEMAKYA
jgi:glycine cleavage system H protein